MLGKGARVPPRLMSTFEVWTLSSGHTNSVFSAPRSRVMSRQNRSCPWARANASQGAVSATSMTPPGYVVPAKTKPLGRYFTR